ncbi:hypothetical protein D3C86_2169240 [compost metagenome]
MDLPQQKREFGLAFEVDGEGLGLPVHQGEHLAGDAVDQELRAEGGILGGPRQAEQEFT